MKMKVARRLEPARLAVAALVFAALAFGFLASGCSRSGKTLSLFIWSEYIDPALVERFEKEQKLKVVIDTYENTETMMSKVASAGSQYDVVVMSDHAVRTMIKQGLLAPLDPSKIPNAGNVAPRFREPAYDPGGRYSLPYQWGTMGLVYRTDKLPDFKASWATILDPTAQPGPVVLLDSMRDLMGAALLLDGHSPNTRDAGELAEAGKRLQAARTARLLGFYGSPDSVDKVISGDAWVGIAYNGDALVKLDENTEFVLPAEGTIVWVDAMTVPAGSSHQGEAQAFLNFILDAEVGAALSNYIAYATPNQASLPLVEEEMRDDPRIYPPESELESSAMLEDVEEATTLYDQIWTRVKAAK
jgi:spermidine/putrescine transport system substrate-binding protein